MGHSSWYVAGQGGGVRAANRAAGGAVLSVGRAGS